MLISLAFIPVSLGDTECCAYNVKLSHPAQLCSISSLQTQANIIFNPDIPEVHNGSFHMQGKDKSINMKRG